MNWLKKLLNIDDLKEEIKEAAIVNHDEVMLLTLETERLERELIVSKNAKNEADAKAIKLDKALTDCETKYMQVAEENIKLKRNSNVSDVKRYKQYCREKDAKIESLSVLYENNKNLREAYEFIEDMSNKQDLMKNLGYNFKRYVDENNINITTLAKDLGLVRETLRRIYESTRGTSITTFKLIEYDMCKKLDCNSLDLVKKKVSE